MSREAFEKLLKYLPDEDKQRIMRVAHEFGIGYDDPAWIGLAVTEHGVIAINKTLETLHEADQRIATHLQQAEQQLKASLRAATEETLVQARATLIEEAHAAKQRMAEKLTSVVETVSRSVADATVQRERNKWLAIAFVVAFAVIAAVGGLGWWLGRLDRDQAVAEIKAQLPAMAAWAKAFDSAEKRQRATWALSAKGEQVYQVARLNADLSRLLTCDFGDGIGYTKRAGDFSVCYPVSAKTGQAAGFTVPAGR